MKVQYKRTICNTEITIIDEPKSFVEVFKTAAFVSGLPTVCGHCGKDHLVFSWMKAQEKYEYCEIKCLDCNYGLKYGQRLDGKTVFAKTWEAPYNPETDGEDSEDDGDSDEDETPRKKTKSKTKTTTRAPLIAADASDDDEDSEEEDTDEEEEARPAPKRKAAPVAKETDEDEETEDSDEEEEETIPVQSKSRINEIAAKFGVPASK